MNLFEIPGADSIPCVHPSVVHMLYDAALRNPGGEALVCGEERLTYAGYFEAVAGLANELRELGVQGQRVALLLGNSIDLAIAIFAVQAAGGQVVPLNPSYTPYELEPILSDADPVMLIYASDLVESVLPVAKRLGISYSWAVGQGARRLCDVKGTPTLLSFPDTEALSTLQYTGGTTGRSKGVELMHRAVAINVSQREALLPTEPECERVLAITPLFHVYATAMCLYLAVYARSTLVILPRYHPRLALNAIQRERITLFSGSPTIFSSLMKFEDFASTDFSSLRLCFSGASALSPDMLSRWEAATGTKICEGYGQSESGPVLTFNPRNGVRKAGSVGIPTPCTEIEIVGAASNQQPRQEGEIRVRGPQLMRGYRNLPKQTGSTLRGGWLYTGDVGWLDEDGYLYISDRKKDLVIVSGFNVYPREVEDALAMHPGVDEAAVIGRPDAHQGEILIAYIVLRPQMVIGDELLEEQMKAHLESLLAAYKIPSIYEVVPALPKTTVGKIDKQVLRSRSK